MCLSFLLYPYPNLSNLRKSHVLKFVIYCTHVISNSLSSFAKFSCLEMKNNITSSSVRLNFITLKSLGRILSLFSNFTRILLVHPLKQCLALCCQHGRMLIYLKFNNFIGKPSFSSWKPSFHIATMELLFKTAQLDCVQTDQRYKKVIPPLPKYLWHCFSYKTNLTSTDLTLFYIF